MGSKYKKKSKQLVPRYYNYGIKDLGSASQGDYNVHCNPEKAGGWICAARIIEDGWKMKY